MCVWHSANKQEMQPVLLGWILSVLYFTHSLDGTFFKGLLLLRSPQTHRASHKFVPMRNNKLFTFNCWTLCPSYLIIEELLNFSAVKLCKHVRQLFCAFDTENETNKVGLLFHVFLEQDVPSSCLQGSNKAGHHTAAWQRVVCCPVQSQSRTQQALLDHWSYASRKACWARKPHTENKIF